MLHQVMHTAIIDVAIHQEVCDEKSVMNNTAINLNERHQKEPVKMEVLTKVYVKIYAVV